jgi:ABC-type oligopeptide transport system ATPase subunit
MTVPVLKACGICKRFTNRQSPFRAPIVIEAVDMIDLYIDRGETLGLVGESGSGKSTLGRALLQLDPPTEGSVWLSGQEITGKSQQKLRPLRRHMQMIFQDPQSSLNPRMTVYDIIAEPIVIAADWKGRVNLRKRVLQLLDLVRLPASTIDRYPREFSGGQRQRIGIARAIALNPSLIVADEAVSSLDVSIQAQVINLLMDLQRELGFANLFIAHDLAVVRHVADRIAVMFLGRIVELAKSDDLFANPRHPYTKALLSAAPIPDPLIEAGRRASIQSVVRRRYPAQLSEVAPNHFVAPDQPESY